MEKEREMVTQMKKQKGMKRKKGGDTATNNNPSVSTRLRH